MDFSQKALEDLKNAGVATVLSMDGRSPEEKHENALTIKEDRKVNVLKRIFSGFVVGLFVGIVVGIIICQI